MSDIPHRIPLAWCTAEWPRLGFAGCGNIMVGLDFPAQKYFAIRWQYSSLVVHDITLVLGLSKVTDYKVSQ